MGRQKFANSSNMKYCLVSSILLPFFSFVASLPTADDNELSDGDTSEKCTDVFSKIGLNYSSFWEGASHGIHSLSLEEIRYFFKADAPEKNKIPTVILISDQRILLTSMLHSGDMKIDLIPGLSKLWIGSC